MWYQETEYQHKIIGMSAKGLVNVFSDLHTQAICLTNTFTKPDNTVHWCLLLIMLLFLFVLV